MDGPLELLPVQPPMSKWKLACYAGPGASLSAGLWEAPALGAWKGSGPCTSERHHITSCNVYIQKNNPENQKGPWKLKKILGLQPKSCNHHHKGWPATHNMGRRPPLGLVGWPWNPTCTIPHSQSSGKRRDDCCGPIVEDQAMHLPVAKLQSRFQRSHGEVVARPHSPHPTKQLPN